MVLQRGDVVCAKVEALSEEERRAFENDGIVMRRAVGGSCLPGARTCSPMCNWQCRGCWAASLSAKNPRGCTHFDYRGPWGLPYLRPKLKG